jgi:protein SCO1
MSARLSPGVRRAVALAVDAAALGSVALMLAACGSSGSPGAGIDLNGSDGPGNHLQGLILRPLRVAPALVLHDYTSTAPVNIDSYRGRAVLVTFLYTHCPNVCPLIAATLATAQRNLGARAAGLVKILAVTVDPRRDTPAAVDHFLAARDAVGRMDYLLGSPRQLLGVWKRWDVAVTLGKNHLTDGHSAVIYGINARGQMADVYPSNVTPAALDHDIPLLARG